MYINLPGSYVQLQDGNLSFTGRDSTQSVLVLGTAGKGLTSEPFLATSLGAIIKEFGSDSELSRTISEVRKGGATNVFAYRLPGVASEVVKIGADGAGVTSNGITIRTTQESPEAALNYIVAYRHAVNYAEAAGAASKSKVVGELIVINKETEEIVWLGSGVSGPVVDGGEIDVQFDYGDLAAAPGSTPEALVITFGTPAETVVAGNVVTIPFSGKNVTFTVPSTPSASNIAQAFKTAATASGMGLDCFTFTGSAAEITVTANGTVSATSGFELVYPSAHPWAGYTARPFISGLVSAVTSSSISTVVPPPAFTSSATGMSKGLDIGLFPQDTNIAFAASGGIVGVRLDKIVAGGATTTGYAVSYGLSAGAYTSAPISTTATYNGFGTTRMVFTAGSTGQAASLMKRYEKLHTAFENLDLAAFDFILPCSAALDSKNVAEGATLTITPGVYPTAATANDALGYVNVTQNGDYTYTYRWSDSSAEGAPKLVSDGSARTGTYAYQDVNFAHLLAKYCYENSSDYRSCMGVIGTTLPSSLSARGIREFFGKAPTYSFSRESGGYYIVDSGDNGTGLLGHRFVGGDADFNGGAKRGGLYATLDGSLNYSASNVLKDDNDRYIDLGKYLLVVGLFGLVVDEVDTRRPPYIVNAAPIIAGLLPKLPIIDSLINRQVPGMSVNYRLETKVVDVACGLGLVVAKNENGIPMIADSPTFASPASDFTRLTTVRIVGKIAEELRLSARPFLGRGLSGPKRAALEAAIGEVIKTNLGEGTGLQIITDGKFKLTQSAADRVLGKIRVDITITPVFELRQITFSVSLSA